MKMFFSHHKPQGAANHFIGFTAGVSPNLMTFAVV
jgi:hypothetical protein